MFEGERWNPRLDVLYPVYTVLGGNQRAVPRRQEQQSEQWGFGGLGLCATRSVCPARFVSS